MSLASVLIRLLLSVSLALGGAAPAMARMGAAGTRPGHAAAQVLSPASARTAAMHCHGHAAAAASGKGAAPAATPPAGHGDGCCPSGKCDCACMHPAQLVMRVEAIPPGKLLHAAVAARLRGGHQEPVLPHLIRPPNAPAALGA